MCAQTRQRPTRKAIFIVRRGGSAADLTELIGATPDQSRESKGDGIWELRREGTGSDDMSGLVEDVLRRVRACRESILKARDAGDARIIFRIVEYTDKADAVGPGFAISPENIALLSELNASIDADLY